MDEQQDEQLALIEANARLAVQQLSEIAGVPFGLNQDSVVWVDGFIERQRLRMPDPGSLPSVLGCFVGACIIEATGGCWEPTEHGWGVRLQTGDMAFPMAKVSKQFEGGHDAGDSVESFYRIVVDIAAGRFSTNAMQDAGTTTGDVLWRRSAQ